ncbi:MAG: type II toxin-antitoxin system RelE/ParE family toxin [Thermodesulfobacteriota bacterium]|nr:type II toxin-antitoxin system RelE/ParE family toxin [Thermodesulfobacteriota bacterium]
MTPVIFDPDARAEFLAAIQYYEDCRQGLGRRFRLVVESATRSIAEAPFRYRVVQPPFRRLLLTKFPYALIYTIEPDHIRVVAVAHTKRTPGFWLDRGPDMGDKPSE